MEWNDSLKELGDWFLFDNMPTYGSRRADGAKKRSAAKRASTVSRKRSIPRSIGLPASSRCIIPLTTRITFPLTADIRSFFTFDTENIYVQGTGVGTYAVPGATDIGGVFDLARVHKVEMTIMGSANDLPYTADSALNIPHVYTAFDPSAQDVKAAADMYQLGTLKNAQLDKVIRRVFYPRLEGSNGIIDVGVNQKNLFEKHNSASTQRWRGIQLMTDNVSTNFVNATCSVIFKVFYEVMSTK